MPDNKQDRGQQDRSRVSAEEEYEIKHLIQASGASREAVMEAIKQVGNSREKILEHLRKNK
jgi:hypothetical protein